MRQEIGTIRKHIDHEASVAHWHRIEKPRPRLHCKRQWHNALLVFSEPELLCRAQHAFRVLAANLSLLDLHAPGERGADGRERVERVDGDVGGATHDVQQSPRAGIDFRDPEVIGVRMPRHLDDATDNDVAQILAQRDEIVDRRAAGCEEIAQLNGSELERDERAQPLVGGVHIVEAVSGRAFTIAGGPNRTSRRRSFIWRSGKGISRLNRRESGCRGCRSGASRCAPVPCRTPSRCSDRRRAPPH